MNKLLPFLLLSIMSAPFAVCADNDPRAIKINTFRDSSNYGGKWDLGTGVSAVFRDKMPQKYFMITDTGPEYILDGDVREMAVSSRGFASYGMGGYQDYSAKIIVQLTLKDSKNKTVRSFSVIGRRVQSNLGLSLLGGPVGDDKYKGDMERLWSLKFGSQEFMESIAGQAVTDAVYQALPKISLEIGGQPYGLRGEVVKVRGKDIFLDIGSDNGVIPGQSYVVHSNPSRLYHPKTGKYLGDAPGARIGRITIDEVLGPNLSIAKIAELDGSMNISLDTNGPVKEDDYVVFE